MIKTIGKLAKSSVMHLTDVQATVLVLSIVGLFVLALVF